MEDNIYIKDIMSDQLITLHPKEHIDRVKEVFKEYRFHHIPVTVMDKLVGIISLGDLHFLEKIVSQRKNHMLNEITDHMVTADQIMTENPFCVRSDQKLSDALDIMTEKRINALPVVDNNKLVGLLTTFDVLLYLKINLKNCFN